MPARLAGVLVDQRRWWCSALNAAGVAVSPWWEGYHRGLEWSDFPEARALKMQAPLATRAPRAYGERFKLYRWRGAFVGADTNFSRFAVAHLLRRAGRSRKLKRATGYIQITGTVQKSKFLVAFYQSPKNSGL